MTARERFLGCSPGALAAGASGTALPVVPGRRNRLLRFPVAPGRSDASGSAGADSAGGVGSGCRGESAAFCCSPAEVAAAEAAAGGADGEAVAEGSGLGGVAVGAARRVVAASGASGSNTGCLRCAGCTGAAGFGAVAAGEGDETWSPTPTGPPDRGFGAAAAGEGDETAGARLAKPRCATSFCGLIARTRSRQ